MAKLYFKFGAMKSGKTTDILKTYYNYTEKGMNTLIIKPGDDKKAGTSIQCRSGAELKTDYVIPKDTSAYDIIASHIVNNKLFTILNDDILPLIPDDKEALAKILPHLIEKHLAKVNIGCIFVDEAQFLMPFQVDELADVVDDFNVPVLCYGLRADAFSHLFPGSQRLFEIADVLEELKAVCTCGEKATFNLRLNKVGDKFVPVFTGNQIAIDGIDSDYDSVCRECYKKLRRKYEKK